MCLKTKRRQFAFFYYVKYVKFYTDITANPLESRIVIWSKVTIHRLKHL